MKKLKNTIYIIPLILVIGLFIYQPAIAQTKVFIPDINFRNFLNAEYPTFMDAGGDSLIADSASTLTSVLDCNSQNISDLTGIEYFINITELVCFNNQLYSLPGLSANTALSKLWCSVNQLTSLPDLSANTALTSLNCINNQLTSLPGLSVNTALSELYCSDNQLTSLPDLSTNIALQSLYCGTNQLTSLDVSVCIALEELNLSQMPTLYEVCVWEMPFPPAGISVDIEDSPNVYFTTDCAVNSSSAYKKNNTISIYPNPNSGSFNITMDLQQTESIKLLIYNSLGQQVFQENLKQINGAFTRHINLKRFPSGIYYMQVLSVKGIINKKIIFE